MRQIWPPTGRPLGCASDRTQNIQFGVVRVGRLRDQIPDQNGGYRIGMAIDLSPSVAKRKTKGPICRHVR